PVPALLRAGNRLGLGDDPLGPGDDADPRILEMAEQVAQRAGQRNGVGVTEDEQLAPAGGDAGVERRRLPGTPREADQPRAPALPAPRQLSGPIGAAVADNDHLAPWRLGLDQRQEPAQLVLD